MAQPKADDIFNNVALYFLKKEQAGKKERSLFIDMGTNRVIMKGIPHPGEYVVDELSDKNMADLQLDRACVYDSLEGTSIHVYYHDGQWYTSTHKKINAFKSYWADCKNKFGISFARGLMTVLTEETGIVRGEVAKEEMKEEECKTFLTMVYDKYLNKELKYTFLLPPIFSERIGSKPTVPWPVPVVTVVRNDKFEVLEGEKTFPGISYSLKHQFTKETLVDYVKTCNPDKLQGVYVRLAGQSYQTKIYNRAYQQRMDIRNNTPNLSFRSMFLRREPEAFAFFKSTYPEFDSLKREMEIDDVCNDIERMHFGKEGVKFSYKEVHDILARKNQNCTFANLKILSYTAPVLFNRLISNRKKAIKLKDKMSTEALLDQMEEMEEL